MLVGAGTPPPSEWDQNNGDGENFEDENGGTDQPTALPHPGT